MAEEVTREEIEAAIQGSLFCAACGAALPQPDCGHKVNGVPNACAASVSNAADAVLELLAASQSRPTKEADYKLPCDVHLPPDTFFRRGCSLDSLLIGIRAREQFPDEATRFEPTKEAAPSASGRGVVAEGWQLVPKVRTSEMKAAAYNITDAGWEAALASAPAPSLNNEWLPIEGKWLGLFRIALGALASIAADRDTSSEAVIYAQNTMRALTTAANDLGGAQ